MSALALVITPEIREQMRKVVAHAKANPTSLETLALLVAGELQPDHVNEGKTLDIPMGFHVVYTHEHQPNGILRHLSVSIVLEGRVPHPEAVRMIMREIGFLLPLEQCLFWEEPCGGNNVAINVVEPLDGDWAAFKNPQPWTEHKIAGFGNVAEG